MQKAPQPPQVTCKSLDTPSGLSLNYVGPELNQGALPAFFYFSLSGEESLCLDPYNQPVAYLSDAPLRCISMTMPGHGPGFDSNKAIQYWAQEMAQGRPVLAEFIDQALLAIDELILMKIVDPDKMAIGGLSRGAFLATHVAAREPRIKTLLGFAPLTRLSISEEFQHSKLDLSPWNLQSLTHALTQTHVRFYIGNRDVRVGTEACFAFIHDLSEVAFQHRVRSPQAELFITPSVGHKGHGTLPPIFFDGSQWIRERLC